MPKKLRVRTLMESEHVKVPERMLKSAQQSFCNIFWSLRNQISSKNYFLVVSEILRLFFNILTPDQKYSLSVKASVPRNQLEYRIRRLTDSQYDSQHVKVSERMLKSSRHYFCHIFWSLCKDISSKKFFLVVSEILRLFVNILTPDVNYSHSVKSSV